MGLPTDAAGQCQRSKSRHNYFITHQTAIQVDLECLSCGLRKYIIIPSLTAPAVPRQLPTEHDPVTIAANSQQAFDRMVRNLSLLGLLALLLLTLVGLWLG